MPIRWNKGVLPFSAPNLSASPAAVLLIAAVFLAVACGGPGAPEPLVFFPEDEAPHDTQVEWWYFNGLVSDDAGSSFSFHYVTFQTESIETVAPHLMHASLTDVAAGIHVAGERPGLLVVPPNATGVDAAISGWVMTGDGDSYTLKFDLPGYVLELEAVPDRPPALHGGTGLVNLGPAGSTYYYSRTRVNLTGFVEANQERTPVTGLSWMDHQWGQVSDQRVGWDWASVQLDDETDLMTAVVWDPRGREHFAAYGTFVTPDGAVLHLEEEDVSLTASNSWTSPDTGVEYPIGWRIEIGTLDLELELEPLVDGAEFGSSEFVPAAYWEGGVTVSGTRDGQPVTGQGFVELVGYDPRQLEAPFVPASR